MFISCAFMTKLAFGQSGSATIAPDVQFTSSGSGIVVSATDNVTTGFDIYVDNVYTMSFTLDAQRTPITFSPPGDWCEVTAAAWSAGGLNHSLKAPDVVNTSNSACATGLPITGGYGVCVDSIAYDSATSVVLSSETHCF